MLEAPKFPIGALPSRLSVTYALTSAFARKNTIVDEKAARIAITETGAD